MNERRKSPPRMRETVTIQVVRRALLRPLPGPAAHQRMRTRPRVTPEGLARAHSPREGAVLVLLYPDNGQLYLPLTRRTQRVENHKGEISLPGGAREPEDLSFWDTALREAEEEIGIDRQSVERLAELSPLYITPSNFEVHPFVGYLSQRPALVADPREVAEIIEFPLETLLELSHKAEETWPLHGQEVRVPFYRLGSHIIWGATAMMLSELEVMLTMELQA
jgi:8-oxo-dGTP pyrophosphatase MutT (NUDIX family)